MTGKNGGCRKSQVGVVVVVTGIEQLALAVAELLHGHGPDVVQCATAVAFVPCCRLPSWRPLPSTTSGCRCRPSRTSDRDVVLGDESEDVLPRTSAARCTVMLPPMKMSKGLATVTRPLTTPDTITRLADSRWRRCSATSTVWNTVQVGGVLLLSSTIPPATEHLDTTTFRWPGTRASSSSCWYWSARLSPVGEAATALTVASVFVNVLKSMAPESATGGPPSSSR